MKTKLYVGNLPWKMDEQAVSDLFGGYGAVTGVILARERDGGRSRGFGFVTLDSHEAADKACRELSDREVDGRHLTVNEARPRSERPPGERHST